VEQVPETGGPVYPGKAMDVFEMNERGQLQVVYSSGMTLRDHFAGLAMQVLMAETNGEGDDNPGSPRWGCEEVSELAYDHADAMLKARK
jgi:hypothetical protein